jgi:hypothetical protein
MYDISKNSYTIIKTAIVISFLILIAGAIFALCGTPAAGG